MSRSISRFVLNDEGNIIDTAHRFPLVPACRCNSCQQLTAVERDNQVYLRRGVLRAQLSSLTEKLEFLHEAEAHALTNVIYWTIYVSQLDWTIGQEGFDSSIENGSIEEVIDQQAPTELPSLLPFLDDVECLLHDLYEDCDRDLLGDVLEAIRAIAIQWDRARTASSRSFFERLSKRVNVPLRSLGGAPLVPDGRTVVNEILVGSEPPATVSIGSKG
jgi:hypothetical protein